MRYINKDTLQEIRKRDFLNIKPYPWINPEGVLTQWGHHQLINNLPDISLFTENFNVPRKYGQKPHDRYQLIYKKGIDVPTPWKEFIEELRSQEYKKFISELFKVRRFNLGFHWQFAVVGCSVSPHCDGERKIGSHIFYLNASDEWNEEWGGETVVLDDDGKFNCFSSPSFDAFKNTFIAKSVDNHSLIFAKTDHSWHGVRELTAPKGKVRKIFVITVDKKPSFMTKLKIYSEKYLKLRN